MRRGYERGGAIPSEVSTTHAVVGLVVILAVTAAAPVIGGWATASSVDSEWFRALHKPGWNPPDWVFGPVWTLLYALMALSAWMVWKRLAGDEGSATLTRAMALPLGLYAAQLALNVAWSVIFFAMREVGWAFVELVALWVMIVATTIAFARVSAPAAWLMSPYLAWVTFAGALNIAIWRMNT